MIIDARLAASQPRPSVEAESDFKASRLVYLAQKLCLLMWFCSRPVAYQLLCQSDHIKCIPRHCFSTIMGTVVCTIEGFSLHFNRQF